MFEHDESGHLHIAGIDVEKVTTYALLATTALAAMVVAAPLALPYVGIGGDVEAKLLDECCKNIDPHSGITWGITKMIEDIPVVGTYLNTANGQNWWMPPAAMLGGYAAGTLVSNMEKEAGGQGTIGSAIRTTSMGLGVVLALPALMPGIAHGTLFLGRLTGMEKYLEPIAQGIGTNSCAVKGPKSYGYHEGKAAFGAVSGTQTSLGLLAGHAGCMLPAAISVLAPATLPSARVDVKKLFAQPGQVQAQPHA